MGAGDFEREWVEGEDADESESPSARASAARIDHSGLEESVGNDCTSRICGAYRAGEHVGLASVECIGIRSGVENGVDWSECMSGRGRKSESACSSTTI